jgi:tetratricopeptide (TPR) repeat protein
MRKFSFILLFFVSLAAGAQVNADSLARIWQDENAPDTARLQAIHRWAWSLTYQNPDSFFHLVQIQLAFARERGHRWWEARALNSAGVYRYLRGDYTGALANYQESLSIFQELGDEKRISSLFNNIGLIYREKGAYLTALEYVQKSLAINEKLRDTAAISGDYNNLANIYKDRQDRGKALLYYEKSLAIKGSDKNGVALIYNNMGATYAAEENLQEKALEYYRKSLDIRLETGDKVGAAVNYHNMGQAYAKMGDYDLARQYLQKGIELHQEIGDKNGVANAWYILGDISNLQNQNRTAVKWCDKSLALSREIGALPIERRACHCLYQAYKTLGEPGRALEYHELFKKLSDSLQQEDLEIRLSQLEFQREIFADSLSREEERLKVELAHQSEIRKKNRTMSGALIAALSLLLFALGFLSRMLYFQKRSERFQGKARQLETQQLISEIALLRTQINPHFLFNSLSILSSLVHIDPDLSEKFIEQLSKSYRYILEQRDQSLVSLRTELDFIYSYVFLLKIRFEGKFDIVYELSEHDLDRFKIAPLTLQLLIENAVKHNRMSVKEPLRIMICMEGDTLLVKNALQPRTSNAPSTGMGLQNIKHTYALLTDRPVWAGEMAGDFVVRVPLAE